MKILTSIKEFIGEKRLVAQAVAVWNYQKARNILWFIKNYFRSIIVKCTHSISRQVVYTLHFVWAFHSSCLEYVSAVNYHHFMMLRLHLFDIKFPAPIAQVCACNKNYWIFYNLLIARALCVFFIIFHSALALARFLCQKLWKSFLTRHMLMECEWENYEVVTCLLLHFSK